MHSILFAGLILSLGLVALSLFAVLGVCFLILNRGTGAAEAIASDSRRLVTVTYTVHPAEPSGVVETVHSPAPPGPSLVDVHGEDPGPNGPGQE